MISVRFNTRGKAYFFDPTGINVDKGSSVVVETAKGLEYGECINGNHMVEENSVVRPLRPVIRIATEEDESAARLGKEKEKEAFDYCQKRIDELGLEMKLVNVEYGFGGNKILFFFTSDGRVDFRELVKDIAGVFRTRIELRQIGVRDETKMMGGLGLCGKPFCCSQFLREFHPVSIKMAKTQGLSLNPTKISGTCGRLMCCLKYEEFAYEELVKKAPKIDAFVETPSGKGTVTGVNLLRGNAKVRLEEGVDTTLKTFSFDELDVLGGKGRRAEYIAAKDEGRLEEAGFTVSQGDDRKAAQTKRGSNEYRQGAKQKQGAEQRQPVQQKQESGQKQAAQQKQEPGQRQSAPQKQGAEQKQPASQKQEFGQRQSTPQKQEPGQRQATQQKQETGQKQQPAQEQNDGQKQGSSRKQGGDRRHTYGGRQGSDQRGKASASGSERQQRDAKDSKHAKDTKDARDSKETRDTRDSKETRDSGVVIESHANESDKQTKPQRTQPSENQNNKRFYGRYNKGGRGKNQQN